MLISFLVLMHLFVQLYIEKKERKKKRKKKVERYECVSKGTVLLIKKKKNDKITLGRMHTKKSALSMY